MFQESECLQVQSACIDRQDLLFQEPEGIQVQYMMQTAYKYGKTSYFRYLKGYKCMMLA